MPVTCATLLFSSIAESSLRIFSKSCRSRSLKNASSRAISRCLNGSLLPLAITNRPSCALTLLPLILSRLEHSRHGQPIQAEILHSCYIEPAYSLLPTSCLPHDPPL